MGLGPRNLGFGGGGGGCGALGFEFQGLGHWLLGLPLLQFRVVLHRFVLYGFGFRVEGSMGLKSRACGLEGFIRLKGVIGFNDLSRRGRSISGLGFFYHRF